MHRWYSVRYGRQEQKIVDTSDASDVVEKQLMPEDSDWMKHNRQALTISPSLITAPSLVPGRAG